MIGNYFTQAELSLAAYATLATGVPNKVILEEAGLPATQATHFASTYTVVATTDPDPPLRPFRHGFPGFSR